MATQTLIRCIDIQASSHRPRSQRAAAPRCRRGPGADVEHGEVRGFTAQRLQAVAVLDGCQNMGLRHRRAAQRGLHGGMLFRRQADQEFHLILNALEPERQVQSSGNG